MIKYLLLVSLITAPFAQQAEAVVTHYDLDGNLIESDASSQVSGDLDGMSSMMMNMQESDSLNMADDTMAMDSVKEESLQSQSTEEVSNFDNISSGSAEIPMETESQVVDSTSQNSVDIMSPMMENEQQSSEQPESNTIDVNSMDLPNNDDPNMAIESSATDSLMASPDMDNGFVQASIQNQDGGNGDEHSGEEQQTGEEHHQDHQGEENHQDHQGEENQQGDNQQSSNDDGANNNSEENHEGGDPQQGNHQEGENHEEQTQGQHGEDHPSGQELDANDLFMSSPDLEHGFVQSSVTDGEHEGEDQQGGDHSGEEQHEGENHDGEHHQGENHSESNQGENQSEGQEGENQSENHDGENQQHGEENQDGSQQGQENQDGTQQHGEENQEGAQQHGEENQDGAQHNGENQEGGQHEGDQTQGDGQLQQSEAKPALVQGNCIIIYSQCNFKGESLEACNSLSEIENFKADIKSIYIPDGLGLTVYDGENFTGKTHKFKSSQECLAKPLSLAQLTTRVLAGQNLRANK